MKERTVEPEKQKERKKQRQKDIKKGKWNNGKK